MNTTELIEIARECGALVLDTAGFVHFDSAEQLQQFAQRIEQPHLQRILELTNRANKMADNLEQTEKRLTEIAFKACANLDTKDTQIAKLREALREVSFIAKTFVDGYEDLSNSVGIFEAEKTSIRTARKQINAIDIKMIKESQ